MPLWIQLLYHADMNMLVHHPCSCPVDSSATTLALLAPDRCAGNQQGRQWLDLMAAMLEHDCMPGVALHIAAGQPCCTHAAWVQACPPQAHLNWVHCDSPENAPHHGRCMGTAWCWTSR